MCKYFWREWSSGKPERWNRVSDVMVDFQIVRFGNERKNVLNVLERVNTEDYSSRWEIWRVVRDGVTDRTMGTMVRERVPRVPSSALELSLFNRAWKFGNVPYPCSAEKNNTTHTTMLWLKFLMASLLPLLLILNFRLSKTSLRHVRVTEGD